MPTLDELLTIPTQDDTLDQEVYPELRTRKVRVSDWLVNGVYRAMAYAIAAMRVNVREAVAALAAAGFEDYVFGFSELPNGLDVTEWAPVVAKQRYGLEQIAASSTKRNITLTNSTATPYAVTPGAIIVEFTATGNRYVLDESGTIAASTSTVLSFRSEFATDSANGVLYTDGSGANIVLVTANYPGVTASNVAPTYSDVSHSGSGVGTVTPSGTPTGGDHAVTIRIDSTGLSTTCAWSTRVDGGSWVAQSGASASNLGGYGINVALANNGGSPSFIVGDYYYFSNPGSDITVVGRDVETPQELGARCRGLVPLFAAAKDAAGNFVPTSPTLAAYELLARTASDQVKVVLVQTDATINNKVKILVAAQGAPAPGSVIASVQNYLDSFSMITDLPEVSTPATRTITLGGATVVIVVKKGQKTTAQQAMQRRLQLYFGGVDQANLLSINGLVDQGYVISLMRTTPGVKRITQADDIEINGASEDLQLPVTGGAFELAVWAQDISTVYPWNEE